MIDFCDFHKRKSACGGVSWDPNSPPPKPHEIHTRHPPPGAAKTRPLLHHLKFACVCPEPVLANDRF
eukprot:COSAG06_NODE_1338_length_9815_cov_25.206258_7_plen_67_part_00